MDQCDLLAKTSNTLQRRGLNAANAYDRANNGANYGLYQRLFFWQTVTSLPMISKPSL